MLVVRGRLTVQLTSLTIETTQRSSRYCGDSVREKVLSAVMTVTRRRSK